MIWEKVSPAVALSRTGIEIACEIYRDKGDGTMPTTVAVSCEEVQHVYSLYAEDPSFHRLLVIGIPGMPWGLYFVCGPQGIVWSLV